jgi:uncharacterized protein with GYD domain
MHVTNSTEFSRPSIPAIRGFSAGRCQCTEAGLRCAHGPHSGGPFQDLQARVPGAPAGARVLDIAEQEKTMTKYLFEANYVGEGIKGLMREGGTARRAALTDALNSVGGSLESFYYAFGDTDVLGVFDVPDTASAAALSLMINSSGNVNVRLKPLLTPEEIDEAAKKTPSYRAPGQ